MRPCLPIALSLREKIRKACVARMERSVIRDCLEASMPPRISLRSIRATTAAKPIISLRATVGFASLYPPYELRRPCRVFPRFENRPGREYLVE